jgi:hypothetical protein
MAEIDFSRFVSLKGEFEAEGLARDEVAVEALYAARHNIDYLVKIGGCEAKSDIAYLQRFGITSVVAPMIESAFAMEKYMGMLPSGAFSHVGVTIETINAVRRIDDILDAGTALTNVTIGRSDLNASYRGAGVNTAETIAMVKTVARAGRKRDLEVTMGGGVNSVTRDLLRTDAELADLLDCVETRKVIMSIPHFVDGGTFEDAIAVELELLELRSAPLHETLSATTDRTAQIRERL